MPFAIGESAINSKSAEALYCFYLSCVYPDSNKVPTRWLGERYDRAAAIRQRWDGESWDAGGRS